MWTRLTSRPFDKRTIPWAFALITLLAYGLLVPWMGFYWDDWVFIWLLNYNGPLELARSFLPYDPLVSPFFLISSSLIGQSALGWQVFGLVVRLLVSLAAWWTFRQIWPGYPRKVLWAALLFLVYPGYAQQWVAFTHANQEWISFGFFLLSLGMTARSLDEGSSPKWNRFALLAQFIGLATTEYFLGLEFLRPVMIWFLLDPGPLPRKLTRTLRYWAGGFLPVWLIAGIGQYLYHNSEYYGGHGFGEGVSVNLILAFVRDVLPTLRVAAFDAWLRTVDRVSASFSSLTDWLVLGLIFASFTGLVFYFRGLRLTDESTASDDTWGRQAILLGLVGILGGRIPSLIAGMPLELRFDWDRLLISVMLGSSLLAAGLIDFLFREGRRRDVFLSLMVALAIGMQFSQANTFRRDWQNQKNFFWQLAWRAPSLETGTALVTDELPIQYAADLQLSAPLNLIYAPDASGLEYALLYTRNRLGGSLLPRLAPGLPMQGQYRTVTFNSTTSRIVLMVQPGDGCLHLIDPRYVSPETFPGLPQNLAQNLDLSNIGQVARKGDNIAKPEAYLGPEPARNWCYYFQKAELARQFDAWDEVFVNYEQAESAGLTALQPVENIVFIEALARLGYIARADRLSKTTLSREPRLCKPVLSAWERALEASSANQADMLKQIEALRLMAECK